MAGASHQQHEWKVCGSVIVGGRECEHGAEDYQGIDCDDCPHAPSRAADVCR